MHLRFWDSLTVHSAKDLFQMRAISRTLRFRREGAPNDLEETSSSRLSENRTRLVDRHECEIDAVSGHGPSLGPTLFLAGLVVLSALFVLLAHRL